MINIAILRCSQYIRVLTHTSQNGSMSQKNSSIFKPLAPSNHVGRLHNVCFMPQKSHKVSAYDYFK